MEITPSPNRPAPTPWGRLLALVIVLAPVSMLVLLPIGLGLERFVMSGDSMDAGDHGISPGTVLFEREIPLSEVRVGDVITYTPPSHTGIDGLVTHRVVVVRDGAVITQGDAEPDRDPWVLRDDPATVSRVDFTLPLVGYAYLAIANPGIWALVIVSAGLLVLLLSGEMRRRRGSRPLAEPVLARESSHEE